jgi:hypothetical protein
VRVGQDPWTRRGHRPRKSNNILDAPDGGVE